MKNIRRFSTIALLLCIAAFTLSACDILVTWPTKIVNIKGNINGYLGQDVILDGVVREHINIPDYSASFRIDDGTGSMVILDTGTPPPITSKVAFKGVVKRIVVDDMDDVAVQKRYAMSIFGPRFGIDAMKAVIAAGIFIVGIAAIIWALNISVFKWALPVRGPERARALSNAMSYPAMLLLAVFVALFLFSGYSSIPLYILAAFGGIVAVLGIIFSIIG